LADGVMVNRVGVLRAGQEVRRECVPRL
jgi:hypothetical protein